VSAAERIGADQTARKPLRTANPRQFSHSGSAAVSSLYTALAQVGRSSARCHIRRDQQVRRYAELVILWNARGGNKAQPRLPSVREQYRTEHSVRLLFNQANKGLEDLLQRRAARDALEHAALAVEQGGAKPRARGISRSCNGVEVHCQRADERSRAVLPTVARKHPVPSRETTPAPWIPCGISGEFHFT